MRAWLSRQLTAIHKYTNRQVRPIALPKGPVDHLQQMTSEAWQDRAVEIMREVAFADSKIVAIDCNEAPAGWQFDDPPAGAPTDSDHLLLCIHGIVQKDGSAI